MTQLKKVWATKMLDSPRNSLYSLSFESENVEPINQRLRCQEMIPEGAYQRHVLSISLLDMDDIWTLYEALTEVIAAEATKNRHKNAI